MLSEIGCLLYILKLVAPDGNLKIVCAEPYLPVQCSAVVPAVKQIFLFAVSLCGPRYIHYTVQLRPPI